MMDKDAGRVRALRKGTEKVFSQFGMRAKLYALLRLRLAPLVQIEKHVPLNATILDLGCGSGIFATILALGSPERRIKGVDLIRRRVETARQLCVDNKNLQFEHGDVSSVSLSGYACVAMIDLLHHMPYEKQTELLGEVHAHLDNGCNLLIKDLEKAPRWKYLFHYLQDSISYRSKLYFRSKEEMGIELRRIGFDVETVSLASGYPHPHILYLCKKCRA